MKSSTEHSFSASDQYRAQSHTLIPGGAHTYSRGDDQFPALSPAAFVRGKGSRLSDVDGNEFIDCSMALGSVSLGYAYEPVLAAVREQLELGSSFPRPASIELEMAMEFLSAVGAERVKFAKNGSSATTAAVKLARAFTGRELVAFPHNHPFYSYDDWFIGRTLCSSGVPEAIKNLSVTYDSRKPETLHRLFQEHAGRIACVITEPCELIPQKENTVAEVAEITRRNQALFIADEMLSGYRAGWPGGCRDLGIQPDLTTWGKAIGNGFSFCALTGRAEVMDLGGILQTGAPRVFLISTTHGGEAHSIAAARAVLQTYKSEDVLGHHRRIVAAVSRGFHEARAAAGLNDAIDIHDSGWRIFLICKTRDGSVSLALRTLLMQEMIRAGVLFQGIFLPCYSHTDEDAARIVSAFRQSCSVYSAALKEGVEKYLVGPPIRPVFRKYNTCEQSCPDSPCRFESQCTSSVERNGA